MVFVKTVDPDLVIKASTSGARIIYDPIDNFAYAERLKWQHWFYFVGTVIAYNEEMAGFLKAWFKKTTIIHHQWDERLKDSPQAPMNAFKAAYIGHDFNCSSIVPGSGVAMITDTQAMIRWANNFNCHVSVRNTGSLESKMKPATKVSLAAAVGAVIITSPDNSVVELLPKEYPYWCPTIDSFPTVLEKAKAEFNGPIWKNALAMLRDVKDKTSIESVARLYEGI
ncbi:MAG: hypothetical protein HQK87_06950 [Nitrospinae bacterium]|nr:hypothetical protein [Nitrospinota bacterium]